LRETGTGRNQRRNHKFRPSDKLKKVKTKVEDGFALVVARIEAVTTRRKKEKQEEGKLERKRREMSLKV
jgi:hypothetical protein